MCNICGKNYKDYSYYKTHLRIHRGERLYKCNYCNKEYYDASYYKKHTRLHTGYTLKLFKSFNILVNFFLF